MMFDFLKRLLGPDLNKAWRRLIDHLRDREGYRPEVYLDSLGNPTVGVGHLVLPGDNLRVGDTISDDTVNEFLEQDAGDAFEAAKKQARELMQYNEDFIVALGSVNFQLGTEWPSTFPKTYEHLKRGNHKRAVKNLKTSLWARQTPVRVDDFVKSIENAYEKET